MFIIVLGQNVSILIESSSGPSKKMDLYLKCLKIEICCPSTIINIIRFVVFDWLIILYLYIDSHKYV